MFTFIPLATLVITTLINAFGVRLLAILNNIGVATEILGMLVFALILLFFANNQSPERPVRDVRRRGGARTATYLPAFALGMFMALFVVYGFDTAGTFGEETVDASRQAPRGVLSSVADLRRGRGRLPAGGHPVDPGHPGRDGRGSGRRFPIATTITGNLDSEIVAGITVGELYLFVILASVFVCTLAIQGAATRMMFSMGRDRHLPLGSALGPASTRRFRTPANAAIAVGVLAAIPILVVGPIGGVLRSRSPRPG